MVPGRKVRGLLLAGAGSFLAWLLLSVVSPPPRLPWTREMTEARARMGEALDVVAAHCRESGIRMDPTVDPNGTCLVGPELTPLVTTLGLLEAKRTTTNPDWASLLVHLLREAGVEEGDAVAVGASGSFPAFALAAQVAAEVLGARPRVVLSLGASSYGATRPSFHLLDIHRLLRRRGILHAAPVAVSPGGARDVGGGMDPAFRDSLVTELERSGPAVIVQDHLPANVARRLALYDVTPPAAFVNVGGSWANMGTSPRILEVDPGLHQDLAGNVEVPAPERRGVLFQMAARGVPVIHLLHVRGLVQRYGLPWDPVPLPARGERSLTNPEGEAGGWFWVLSLAYLAFLVGVALWSRGGGRFPAVREPR